MFEPHSVFIHTEFDDQHALAVSLALQQRGHSVVRYLGGDLPARAGVAFHYGDEPPRLDLHLGDETVDLSSVDTVWHRRVQHAQLPARIAREDRGFASIQNLITQRSINVLMAQAFWANPVESVRNSNLKPLQLRLAKDCGLEIPRTLISNEPEEIRSFLRAHRKVIFKPMAGHIWEEQGKSFGSFTAPVTEDLLPDEELLRAVPGIFQVQVEKQFEVRAQFFGNSSFAVRIESDQIEYGEFDWRLHQHGGAMSQRIELPPAVHAACRQLMLALNLVCGGFDFIVTPEGRWIFLEVNEAGQFLFLEIWCPELTVVDACSQFLAGRDPNFEYRPCASPARFGGLATEYALESILENERLVREDVPARESEVAVSA